MENLDVRQTESVKCPSCGADMRFDPKTQNLICDHCDNSIELNAEMVTSEMDFGAFDDQLAEQWTEGRAFRCENCGATTTLSVNEIATKCPFCGAPKVVSIDEQPGIKPTSVVPFAFTREDARLHYLKWIKRRIFAPRRLKKGFMTDSINGVYIPCWTYDSETYSTYNGVLGENYTVTVGSGKNIRTVTKTRWYPVSGNISRDFDDVSIEASEQLTQKEYEKIAPYATNHSKVYDPRFMAGFSAERYNRDVKECFADAEKIMEATVRNDIIRRYNADCVQFLNINMSHSNVTYKYVLLPVWICSYSYNQKSYRFYTNGSTGKTTGKTPVSPIRASIAAILGVAIVALIIYYLMFN